MRTHLPKKCKQYNVNQPFGPKKKEPDHTPSSKFIPNFLDRMFVCVNREAKKSGISNHLCLAKQVEVTQNFTNLIEVRGGELLRTLYDYLSVPIQTATDKGDRHAFGYYDYRDIPTNGNTTDPNHPGGKWFWDQRDGRVERKEVRDFIASLNCFCSKYSLADIHDMYEQDCGVPETRKGRKGKHPFIKRVLGVK